jgi:glycosyltransferase involved in cell wall biosynthesis
MKLTLINQYYPPDLAPTGHLAASLADHRVDLGDEVTVITSAGGYAGSEAPSDSTRDTKTRVVRLRTIGFGRASLLRQALGYFVFYIEALWHLSNMPAQDVVIALTTPPWIGWAGWAHKTLRRTPRLVIWTMDVYPEAIERFGTIRSRSLPSRLGRSISRGLLVRADAVVALDRAMKNLLNLHYLSDHPQIHIAVIPNWEPSYSEDGNPEVRDPQAGIEPRNRFTVLYMGNAGRGHDFTTVLDAAPALGAADVQLHFVGGGPQWDHLKRTKDELALENLLLQDYVPRESREAVLQSADCGLIVMRDDALGVISPSKMHGYLAMGLPIIYVGPVGSDVDEVIEEFNCGISLRHGDVQGLIDSILKYASDPAKVSQVSSRARSAFEARYSAEDSLSKYDDLLEGLVGSG